MKKVLVNLTKHQLTIIDNLVEKKAYSSRSEAIRDATRILLKKRKLQELEEKFT